MTNAIKEIPDYLEQYVATQDYDLYTPIDQASWRFIMRLSKQHYSQHAHEKYLNGLMETGISIEEIPRISDMDKKLERFGWRAVPVTGFIPPSIFLEFLSLSIMPIACDMRKLENIDYTPTPDIVHEAAGHAPIIADPHYASYLHKFGEISRRAIFAKEDLEVYEAIKHLSEVKESPKSSAQDIDKAQVRLDKAVESVQYVSEASMLSRLGWWSIEYGLFKKDDQYLIYGAGLLSSVSEGYNCLLDQNVRKIPLTIDCVNVDYDITKPQPQLFYTEDFKELEDVIDQLAEKMAYRRGGEYALKVAMRAETVNTVELDTGVQISGCLSKYIMGKDGSISYLQFSGPTQLSYKDHQIEGQGADYHSQGYGTPLGVIEPFLVEASDLTESQLNQLGFKGESKGSMKFTSGVVLEGVLKNKTSLNGKNLIFTFEDCKISDGAHLYFNPEWGPFDMACGARVESVFGGASDRGQYLRATHQYAVRVKPHLTNQTTENEKLNEMYSQVRSLRESGAITEDDVVSLNILAKEVKGSAPLFFRKKPTHSF